MNEEATPISEVEEQTFAEAAAEEAATWHDTAKTLRFAMIARIAARVVLVLVLVGFGYVTYDVIKTASMMPQQNLWRNLLGQYLAFVSLVMAVVVMEGVAHFLELLVDIEENTRK